MYLRAAKTEAEEAGESTDGMADSVSELRDELKALTGNRLDIMLDDTTFKSTYQILKELSEIWGDISDVSQANILELLAGKRNSNVVSALLQDFSVAEKALLESQNAAGSAMAENEKYLDSINGKLDQLKASWEQLSANVLDSELVKGAIDLIKGLIEAFNELDEATGGASSSILLIGSAFLIVHSIITAFSAQLQSVSLLATGITTLKESLLGLYAVYTVGQTATGTFLGGLQALLGAMWPYVAVLAAVSVGILGIKKAYDAYKKANPTFEDLQEQSSELRSEVDELSSSVETANERIAELRKLSDSGKISLTEQDELNRLEAQNELLRTQLQLKEALLKSKQDEAHRKAQEEAASFMANRGVNNIEQWMADNNASVVPEFADIPVNSPIQWLDYYKEQYQSYQNQINEITASMSGMTEEDTKKAEEKIESLTQLRDKALENIETTMAPLENILANLDPVEDAEIISDLKMLTYEIQYLTGDATALKSVLDDFWSDETTHEGITEYREELEKAANAQRDYNEELKQYGSNVDLTNRPHVKVTKDMFKTGLWGVDDINQYSTIHTVTVSSNEFGDNNPNTEAILVTPMLPDGSYFENESDLYAYLDTLIDENGKYDVSRDTKGITLGVFDEGSLEASIKKAQEMADKAHEVNAAFHDFREVNPEIWQDFVDTLAAIGYNVDELSEADLASMFYTWEEAAESATVAGKTAAQWLETLSDRYDALSKAQKETSETGYVSADTLETILTKYPELVQYLEKTEQGYKASQGALETYHKAQKEAIALALTKAKSAASAIVSSEEAKAAGFKQTTGTIYEQLKALKALYMMKLDEAAYTAEQKGLVANFDEDVKYYRNLANSANNALKELEEAQYDSDNFDSIWNTLARSSTTSSSSSSDSYKTSVQEKINALKHQLQMEKITAEQYYNGLEAIENQYYKDSAAHLQKYADEIRSIDEELFDGRRELNEDWLNDQQDFAERAGSGGDYAAQQDYYNGMFSKLQEMIKAAKDYGLDETSDYVQELYDKVDQLQSDILASVKASFEDFESYMDDFDLWKGSDFSKLDWLKHELNEIIALYDKGQLSWAQYTEARNEIAKKMYDTQRDSLEEILELTMDMIKAEAEDQVEAIDDQVDAYQRLIDKKRALLQDTKDEADHEEEVAEKVKEIAELQSKIAQLSLDDSREATAKKAELEQSLYEKQRELSSLQKDYSLDQTLDALDKTQEAFEDEKEAEKDAVEESVDSWQKLYEKAIKRIEGDWDGLYKDLTRYEAEHRDSIDGPDSLVTAWKNATSAMQEYNNSFEDAYNNAADYSINSSVNQSSEAQAIIAKMNANSALAQAMGTSKVGGRDLHQENIDYADQYYQLTGQKLVYDSTAGWKYDNSTSGSVISSSANKTSSTTQTSSSTSSSGNAYQAAVAKFGSAPTGSPNLKEGSTGDAVKWLQYFLKQAGFLDSSVAVDGQFWGRTEAALIALQEDMKKRYNSSLSVDGILGPATAKYLPKYHTGGIVGDAGSINDTEVLALLKKGEWVLDDTRKQNLKAMFATLKEMTGNMMSSSLLNRMQVMKPTAAVSGGDTFAPQINVSIQHNGSMTDKDAKKYGDMVANTALDQLKSAFTKRGKR